MTTRNIHSPNRRDFLQATAAGAAGLLIAPASARALSSNDKVNLAAVGVGGKGWSDINPVSEGHNVVAFCDVDTSQSRRGGGYGAAAEKWPKARRYTDWRKMLDKEHKNIDGLTVSTPDHMHAPVTMTAMQHGIATYTQKPLSRTVHEARQLTLAAEKTGVVTQMGNQGHSGRGYRTLVKLVQDGAVGKVTLAHAWSNRPIWPQGIDRPDRTDPAPDTLDWNLWLGVAPERPFVKDVYHPFKWRGWYDFGAGALGDMGCHILDPVVWGLDLGAPQSVRYEGPEPRKETFPTWERIHYEFPGTDYTTHRTIDVVWHDGGKLPPEALAQLPKGEKLPSNGILFVGEKGVILTAHGGMPRLLPEEKFADFDMPKLKDENHYMQWTNAIRGEDKTTSNFAYAGPLTETVLLGTIACRFPDETLEWNSTDLRFANNTEANNFVRQEYRKGWEVEGL